VDFLHQGDHFGGTTQIARDQPRGLDANAFVRTIVDVIVLTIAAVATVIVYVATAFGGLQGTHQGIKEFETVRLVQELQIQRVEFIPHTFDGHQVTFPDDAGRTAALTDPQHETK
jgi:hypothetical protein